MSESTTNGSAAARGTAARGTAARGPVPVTPPVARGPIPVTPPETVMAGWAVSAQRSDAALTLADWTPLAKVMLRTATPRRTAPPRDVTDAPRPGDAWGISHVATEARATPTEAHLDVRYGRATHQTWDGHDVLLVGWGPAEWLALGPPGSQATLAERLASAGGTVVDLTHGRALLRLTGDHAADLLARECALDLSDRAAPDGSAFRSAIARVAADLVRDDADDVRSYLLHCEWTLGRYLFESLLDAGDSWGVETDGFRAATTVATSNARER